MHPGSLSHSSRILELAALVDPAQDKEAMNETIGDLHGQLGIF